MSQDLYQEKGQRIYLVDEHTYGEHYDPQSEHAAWTAISGTFPHVIPVNVQKDGLDYDIPIIIKEKIYGIGGGKHPVLIANKFQEPVEFTMECKGQHPTFLAYSIGEIASTKGGTGAGYKEVTEITCLAKASCTDESYFLLNGIDGNGEEHFAIWINTDGAGVKPTIAGIAADHVLECDISGATTATQVATIVAGIINGDGAFGATSDEAVVTVTNALEGAVRDSRDSGTVATGFSFEITNQGCSKHTVTENTGYALPSFTLHIEQRNEDSDEDIIVDLFGCVVESHELTVDFDEKLFAESVTIKCPHYSMGNRLTNAPPVAHKIDVLSWGDLKEAASTYVIMEGSTDKTPEILQKLTLSIKNNTDLWGEIGYDYCQFVVSGTRDVSLNLVGMAKNRDLLDYYKDTWDNQNDRYSSATGKLNSNIKVQRLATYDYFTISIYNWLVEEHNHHMQTISEAIKAIDVTFTDATPDSNGRMIDSFVIYDYLSDTCYRNSWS